MANDDKTGERSEFVTITISRACAEQLYIALAKALGPGGGGKKKKGGGGTGRGRGTGGGGIELELRDLAGDDDTHGHD